MQSEPVHFVEVDADRSTSAGTTVSPMVGLAWRLSCFAWRCACRKAFNTLCDREMAMTAVPRPVEVGKGRQWVTKRRYSLSSRKTGCWSQAIGKESGTVWWWACPGDTERSDCLGCCCLKTNGRAKPLESKGQSQYSVGVELDSADMYNNNSKESDCGQRTKMWKKECRVYREVETGSSGQGSERNEWKRRRKVRQKVQVQKLGLD